MLQFSGIFINLSVRQTTRVPLWYTTQQLMTAYSTISNPKQEPVPKVSNTDDKTNQRKKLSKEVNTSKGNLKPLKIEELFNKTEPGDVEKLLLRVNSKLTAESCLQIISKLSTLVKEGKADINDFESDARYKNLCHLLFLNSSKISSGGTKASPLTQEFRLKNLGFLFDVNEIQKLTENPHLSISEATKIMSKLAFYKSRVLPILQTLACRIVNCNDDMNVKIASDILYNMAVLNFYDESLIQKIVSSLNVNVSSTKPRNVAVIGSILKSIGLLRFRNDNLLSELTKWMLINQKYTRPQDICSYLLTLAVLDYVPKDDLERFQTFVSQLNEADMSNEMEWLDIVWALVLLNQAQKSQVISVLDSQFIQKLTAFSKLSELKKRKILNINAAARLIFEHNTDEFLENNQSILAVTLEKNRDQQMFVQGIVTSLHALLPSSGCLNIDVNTGMGFSVDAEFHVDKNCNPVLLSQVNAKGKEALKIAVQSLTYYDYCRGTQTTVGQINFQCRLLKLLGYNIIPITYKEFIINQKVVDRVKYLKKIIQETVNSSSV